MNLFKSKIKQIVEAAGPNTIPPTQNQEYHNLQNQTFATSFASFSHSRVVLSPDWIRMRNNPLVVND